MGNRERTGIVGINGIALAMFLINMMAGKN